MLTSGPGRTILCSALGAITCAACHTVSPATQQAPNERTARPDVVDTISFDVSEGTRIAFDVSPDARWIVFDLLGQLWRLPIDGGVATPITAAVRDIAEDFDPAISPDGRRIVFQSDRPGGRALWMVDRDGGQPKRLTSRFIDYFAYAAPAWAPDGRRIAFAIGDTVAVLDVDSGTESVLRIDSLPVTPQGPSFTPRNSLPTWSRDGTRIAFVNTAAASVRGDGRIWEVGAEGGIARAITQMPGVAPAWSPDGTRLAFLARDSTGRWQVWTQARNASARRLTNHDEVVTYRVRWTPDGRSLIYVADGRLWRVSLDGGTPAAIPFSARLTMARRRAVLPPVTFPEPGSLRVAKGFTGIALSPDGRRIAMLALDSLWVGGVDAELRSLGSAAEAGDNGLTWSPDGEEVAWTRRVRPGRPFELLVTNLRTSATRMIASLGQDVIWPAWSPDGQWIAFFTGRRLHLVDAHGQPATRLEQTRDLGTVSPGWGTLAWSPRSEALLVAGFNFATRRQGVEWIPLAGERRVVQRFPRAAANLDLTTDGHAVWVADNQLWRAPFEGAAGLRGTPLRLSDEPAVEARHARDGSILYLSASGLRLRAPNGSVRPIRWPLRYRVRAAPEPILIRGARVIDGRGTPLTEPRDVLLEGGRIARIAAAGTLSNAGARLVDAANMYLVPGFIDLHTHIWDDLILAARLHNGVTTVRDIASQKLKTPDTRNAIEAGIVEGPRVVYGGAMFHGIDGGYSTLGDQMPNDSGSIARAVAILAEMDARYVKERGFAWWWRAVHLVNAAHRFGMVVSGHCEHILPVVAAGIDGVEHVLDCFRDRFTLRSDFAELARTAGLWVVPTASLRFSMLRGMEDPELLTAPDIAPLLVPTYRPLYSADSSNRRNAAAYTTALQRVERSLRRYNEAGVTLATGSDSPFPIAVIHEMEVLVKSGLTPMQAIIAATGGAARALNAPTIGTIAEGQWADLVLLSDNPLEDIRNTRRIREVIQGGRLVDRAGLRRRGLPQ